MDATTYLQQELDKTNRTIKRSLIALVVIVIVMIGYFEFMKAELAKVLEPESVSDFMISQARAALPEIAESLKYNLTSEAPNVVHYVLNTAVEKALPLAGQTFQTNLDQYGKDVSDLGAEKAGAAFAGAIKAYKASGVKAPSKENAAQFADRLSLAIEAQMGPQLDAVAKEGVQKRLEASGETLKHINAELIAMAARPSADREGEMGKKLITTWWSFLDRGRPKEPNAPMAAEPAPAAKKAK
jgi:hypothetical protein